ncbi:hypothetical protein TNCV_1987901 [Trichonephila clavipes]|nr:hypothetical protein TNCV_1987901 [Trichonephila clavipes]
MMKPVLGRGNRSKIMLFLDASITEQWAIVWFLIEEGELDVGIYQQMGQNMVSTAEFEKLVQKMPAQMSPVKPRQP